MGSSTPKMHLLTQLFHSSLLTALALAPMFLTELQNQEVQDGYPVSFDCIVVGKPLPTVRWFKDGKAIEENDHYMINEDQEGCHQLIITAVVPTDMGVYRCLAENNMGVASTKAELRVDRKHCKKNQKTKNREKRSCSDVDICFSGKTLSTFQKNDICILPTKCSAPRPHGFPWVLPTPRCGSEQSFSDEMRHFHKSRGCGSLLL